MIAVIALCMQLVVTANTVDFYNENMMSYVSFEEIEDILEEVLGEEEIDFQEMVSQLISGNWEQGMFSKENIYRMLKENFSLEKSEFVYLFLLSVTASIFSVFTEVLKDKQIADTWFYMIYMMMCILVFKAFKEVMEAAAWSADSLASFMQALVPAYTLSITLATGPSTGAGFYQCTLILISLISDVVSKFIIPMTQTYVVLKILNYISEEDLLSRMAGLFEQGVKWLLKTSMAALVGFQVIQSLLAPAIDSFRSTSLSKTLSAIPGIGGAAGAVTEMLVGSAVLLKNGIGTAAIVVILLICMPPLIKIALFTLSYKVMSAVLQPIADKRFIGCMGSVADGGGLLLKSGAMIAGMFMLSIAIVGLR